MQLSEFQASLSQPTPPAGLSPALQALWYAAKGDWERAHEITQPGGSALDWVHAYLHRVEGDLGNAAYWYRRAGKPVATGALDAEWAELATALLAN
ncbi:MAG TPA: hypothetical protein DCL15_02955 [Chloroflexi bacterium]|nr:hypothetical protein [Chloroflexota bacterium]HHW88676.1 hypothetical protein [Chloroflexota bacterium]